MAALLVIGTFALFILIDYLLSLRASEREARAAQAVPVGVVDDLRGLADPRAARDHTWVAGYDMPEHLHYHRGHMWARVTSEDTAVVGLDDFARRLVGRVRGLGLPEVGTSLFQGGHGARVETSERAADLVAPVGGEVIAVNPDLEEAPNLATDDPYGRGWLYQIRSSNLAAALRNLLSGSLARKWMEDSREQLDVRLMALSGSVLQDGGEPAVDFGDHVDTKAWQGFVENFLLTQGYERRDS